MEEKIYTQKELYQFVTEYSREAREEGFDASVGDFVDWIEFRGAQKEEGRYVDPILTEIATNSSDDFGAHSWSNRKMAEMLTDRMKNCHCGKEGHATNSINCPVHGYEEIPRDICKPVLPEKLEVPGYIEYRTKEQGEMITVFMPLIIQLIEKHNELIDYIKAERNNE